MIAPKYRFRVAHRTVRRMVRAARMQDPKQGQAEYFAAVLELNAAGARPLFGAALRCQSRHL